MVRCASYLFSAVIGAGLLAGAGVCAQTPNGQTTAAGQDVPVSVPVIQAETNLVLLDVVVTEKQGAVHGIDAKRFHLSEDGKEQAIHSVDEHLPGTAAPALKAMKLPPHVYSNQPLYPEQSAVNVLLMDGLNTAAVDQIRTRQQMLDYMGTIKPGTPMAIFTLTSKLRLVQGFTTDPATLAAAMKSRTMLPQQTTLKDSELTGSPVSVMNGGSMSAGGGDGSGLRTPGALQLFTSDIAAFQTDIRVRMTLEALTMLARYLEGIPGRKNLIWFSGSYPVSMDPEKTNSDSFRGMKDFTDELRKTSVAMNEARVAVYPVDARGLMTLPTYDVAYQTTGAQRGGASTAMSRDNAAATDSLLAEHFAMEQLAEDTGGRAFVNTSDFKSAVADAVAHGASYYTIAYTPNLKGDAGKFHKLKVKVDGGSYGLAYRHGYFTDDRGAQPPRAGMSLISQAMQRGVPEATGLVFEARVLAADSAEMQQDTVVRASAPAGTMALSLKGPTKRWVVDVLLDADSLAYATDASGVRKAQVELAVAAYDGDGARVNSTDNGMAVNLTPEQYARMAKSGIPVRALLDVPAGGRYLRVAVRDIAAARVGSIEVPLMAAGKQN